MNRKNLNIRLQILLLESFGVESKISLIQVKERMKSRWLTGDELRLTAAREDVEELCRWLRESFPKHMTAVSEHMDGVKECHYSTTI